MIRAGLAVGGQFGRGVICVRNRATNTWSAPAFLTIAGGSFGLQIGGQSIDIVLVIMDKTGVDRLLGNQFKIGAEASAAAGPVGRSAEAATDIQMRAKILSYSRSRGLFAGVALNGSTMAADEDANARFYGSGWAAGRCRARRRPARTCRPPSARCARRSASTRDRSGHEALKIGIGGVRGVVGDTFTPELVVAFAQAFGTYLGPGRILVCRDTRPSGPMVAAGVMAGLLATGCDVVDLGVCPTPSLQLAVKWLDARGGHLDHGRAQPRAVERAQVRPRRRALPDAGAGGGTARHLSPGAIREGDVGSHPHAGGARRGDPASPGRPHARASTCGACASGGSRWRWTAATGPARCWRPDGSAELGCEVLAINDDPSSPFPHTPEPKPETMAQVRAVVKAGRADIGLVHDADGERLGLVDETGRALSEELTLALAVDIALRERVGPIVTNVSTTMAMERMRVEVRRAGRFGRRSASPTSPRQSSSTARCSGGEGNGSVAVPRVQPSHDSAARRA